MDMSPEERSMIEKGLREAADGRTKSLAIIRLEAQLDRERELQVAFKAEKDTANAEVLRLQGHERQLLAALDDIARDPCREHYSSCCNLCDPRKMAREAAERVRALDTSGAQPGETNDTQMLDWVIEQCNDPGRTVEQIGRDLCRVIAGGEVGEDIYDDDRSAIKAAMRDSGEAERGDHPQWLEVVSSLDRALTAIGIPNPSNGGDCDEIDRLAKRLKTDQLVKRLKWLRESDRARRRDAAMQRDSGERADG